MNEEATFFWPDTRDVLRKIETNLARDGRSFVGDGVRVFPPPVLPIADDVVTVADYLAQLPDELGRHLVVLLQAGAAALGLFEEGESVRTKSLKKYVVRGRGKAQPTHLESKGKSRYGSRLRLQNARALLVEVNERLIDWIEEFGTPDDVFYSCPVRTWPELFATRPEPPFARNGAIKIPIDVPVPTTDVLLRTYKTMCYGRLERAS